MVAERPGSDLMGAMMLPEGARMIVVWFPRLWLPR